MTPSEISYRTRRAFTLVELLIVIGIIVVLIAIILPATQRGILTARAEQCANNLKTIGTSYLSLANLSADELDLRGPRWFELPEMQPGGDASLLHCPEHVEAENVVSYGMSNRADLLLNGPGDKIAFLDYDRTLAFYIGPQSDPDADEDWREIYDDWPSLSAPRHLGRMNVLLSGGSVVAFAPNDVDPLECYLYEKYWKPARAQGLNRDCYDRANGGAPPDVPLPPGPGPGGSTTGPGEPPPGGTDGGVGDPDPPVDPSIDEGLIWLLRHQLGNGGWSLKHHVGGVPACAGRCPDESSLNSACPAVATGLALLAFLGTGSGPGSGDYQETVSAGVNFLMRQVQPNGYIGNCQPGHAQGYERAFAVMALVECYRRGTQDGAWGTVDPTALYDKAFRAVNYIANCEHANGGFRYSCGTFPDTSVTAAMTQSLKSANEAQFPIAGLEGILPRLHDWLDECQQANSVVNDAQFLNTRFYQLGSEYAYQPPDRHRDSLAMWAAGGYMRLYINPELQYHDAMENLARFLADRMQQNGAPDSDRYFNFYAHHFMRMMGDQTDAGPVWSTWSDAMEEYLVDTRESQGHVRGSWSPGANQRNRQLGRLGVTCLSLLNLRSYYENITLTDG